MNTKNYKDNETSKMIASHLQNTPPGLIQETTYIPMRMVHVLTMLQALEGQFDKLYKQAQEVEKWYAQKNGTYVEPNEDSKEEQALKSHDLFINRFRFSLYQHLRGKDGKFVDILAVLADTDMQTRGTQGVDDLFKRSPREQ